MNPHILKENLNDYIKYTHIPDKDVFNRDNGLNVYFKTIYYSYFIKVVIELIDIISLFENYDFELIHEVFINLNANSLVDLFSKAYTIFEYRFSDVTNEDKLYKLQSEILIEYDNIHSIRTKYIKSNHVKFFTK